MPDIYERLTFHRAKFGALISAAQAHEILNNSCFDCKEDGWGLYRKTSGNQYANCSVDCICNRFRGIETDVLRNAPDVPTNQLGEGSVLRQPERVADLTRWVEPLSYVVAVPPVEPPKPPTPPEPPIDDTPKPPVEEPPATPPAPPAAKWYAFVPWKEIVAGIFGLFGRKR